MIPLLADDRAVASGGATSFWHDYADAATWLGLLLTLVGFGLTLLALWRVRRDTREAIAKVALHALVVDTTVILRLITEARDAGRDGNWARSLDRYQQPRIMAVALAYNNLLNSEEQTALRRTDSELRLVIQFIENSRLGFGVSPETTLPDAKKRKIDAIITALGSIQGRLQNVAWEV